MRVHVYGFGRDVTERAVRTLSDEVQLVPRPEAADVLFVLRSRAGDPRIRRLVEKGTARVHLIKRASAAELRRAFRAAFVASAGTEEEIREAIAEAEQAIDRAMSEGVAVALAPRPPRIRRLQHELAERYHLGSESAGSGGQRHLVIHPPGEGSRREPPDLT